MIARTPRPRARIASLVGIGAMSWACARSERVQETPLPTASACEPAPADPVEEPATTVAVAWLPATVLHWQGDLERTAASHAVDAELLAIVVLVESGGDPAAKSKSGARGLMQLLPLTGRHVANKRKLADYETGKLVDPAWNLDLGAWYLGKQLGAFASKDGRDRTVELAAAAYNGGPNWLTKHLGGEATMSNETERYMRWVGGMWRERRSPRSDTYALWWSAGGSRLVEKAAQALGEPVSAPP